MIFEPSFYLLAIFAVILVGIGKGGFGGALAALSVPLLSLKIPPMQAASIMLPILCVMDAAALHRFRGHYDKVNLRILLPAAIFGIIVGSFTFSYLSDDALRLLIGGIALLFCLNHWLNPRANKITRPSRIKGSFWGAIAGFTSFGLHAGAPPVSIYLLPQQLEKRILVGTFVVFFACVNFIKLIPYTLLGNFDGSQMLTSLVLIPFALIGVRLGGYLLDKVDGVQVYRVVYLSLFGMALKLLWDGMH